VGAWLQVVPVGIDEVSAVLQGHKIAATVSVAAAFYDLQTQAA
jgi:hypothetical protein